MIRWTLLFVVLIILASGAVAFYTVFFRPAGELVIPPLRERTVVDAVAEAERLGFVVQVEPVASSLPEGRVLGQSPEPGTRARRSQVVVLQVSRGGELHAVPDVRGQTLAGAQGRLKEEGFSLGDVLRIRDGSQPGGTVVAQSPASPANVPVSRKIDLLMGEGGAGPEGTVRVPDVNRLGEGEARALLEASGLKVEAVEKVYSPLMPEGLAIETRPGAGTSLASGAGVQLKIATLRRPAGYVEASPTPDDGRRAGGTVRRVEVSQGPESAERPAASGPAPLVVKVPGQGDVFIGDGTATPTDTPIREADPNLSVFDQERRTLRPGGEGEAARQAAPAPTPQQRTPAGGKVARVRYQVPPLTSPMSLRIEVTDPSGRRDVLNRQARSGENVQVEAPYTGECVVSVYLGDKRVWQEKHK